VRPSIRVTGMPTERRRVYYSGRVQGVGFRLTCRRIARGYAVTGYVKNLRDGGVELVAEGEPHVLDLFQSAVRADRGEFIRSESVTVLSPGDPSEVDFSIRY
jgi:acylphosphatase